MHSEMDNAYNQLAIILYLGLFEGLLLVTIALCGVWLMVASYRQNHGKTVDMKKAKWVKKLLFGCVIAFMLSFGICSGWLFLPTLFR